MAFAPGAPRAAGVGDGVMAIIRADPGFDMEKFMAGARAGYELIVHAFAKGDHEALKRLLTPQACLTLMLLRLRRAKPRAKRDRSWCA